jgi:hypothetical protein
MGAMHAVDVFLMPLSWVMEGGGLDELTTTFTISLICLLHGFAFHALVQYGPVIGSLHACGQHRCAQHHHAYGDISYQLYFFKGCSLMDHILTHALMR